MPFVHVCPLSQVAATVASAGASHLVSLINDGTLVARPDSIDEINHLFLGINDITEPQDGMVLPGEEHVRRLVAFADAWERDRPMVIHCFAGISRSTAAAFITLCVARPEREERDIAWRLRLASPFATPNARLVAIADDILDRQGRMVEAIAAIGRGEMAIESVPFALPLGERA
ncbi:MAG: protein tyrosine phosphatase [Bauldia sp.]|nr:protein tyrosine phosphatase [Bauldia sp.]